MAREIRGVQGSEFGGFRHDRSSGGALGAEGRYADSFMGEATATRGGFAPAILRGASAAWRTQRKRRRDGEVDVVKVSIRPATWDDRAAILALVVTMGGHEDVAQHMDPLRELGAMLRSSYARTFVADVDGAVAGVANVQARSSLTEDARIAILSSVAVSESQRGRGIGTLLLDAVDEAARSRMHGHRPAVGARANRSARIYREHGYVEARPSATFRRGVPELASDAPIVAQFLARAARAASAVDAAIVELGTAASVGMGADGAATEAADLAAESAAVAELRGLSLPIVSEEAGVIGDDPRPGDMWIALDPLDGSRNYRAGLPPYGIAIGLVRAGVAIAGFVCDLSSGRRWWAGDDGSRMRTVEACTLGAANSSRCRVRRASTISCGRAASVIAHESPAAVRSISVASPTDRFRRSSRCGVRSRTRTISRPRLRFYTRRARLCATQLAMCRAWCPIRRVRIVSSWPPTKNLRNDCALAVDLVLTGFRRCEPRPQNRSEVGAAS